jgi:hypothetical protein
MNPLNTVSNSSDPNRGPTGIGGWLMLLVVGMMVLGPLINGGCIGSEIMEIESRYPRITFLGKWGAFKSATWWTFLAFTALY